ncbi:acyl-CoA-binding protein [Serpentinimonas barnesii]|uniref:acyl-CoA-binding protein n=1 Tax=Serpentinimonas barnesii TaxID=1458427 RepID=UPI0004966F35|nr:acyl-CoA-binding protein [Serpentinimonas barnesii]
MNTSLQSAFEAAVAASKELTQRPDNATLLKLYALYKQGSEGDNGTVKPGFADLVGRAKWDAWAALKGTDPEEAKQRYIELIESLE